MTRARPPRIATLSDAARRLLFLVPLLALLTVACRSSEAPAATLSPTTSPDASATSERPPIDILPTLTATATPPPTPTPLPPAPHSALWIFDLARGRPTPLYEGDAAVSSRVERSGNGVTATMVDGDRVSAVRFAADGRRVEEHENRLMIVTSRSGESRFYLDVTDREEPELVLEHQGEQVRLEGTRARAGVAFSPSGDRLLTVSTRPTDDEDEEIRTFSVHSTADGRLRMQFEHRARVEAAPEAFWSPSGRYVADRGTEGLFVRDTVSGRAWRLGPDGSARWSPLGDRLLAVTDLDRLSLVNFPGLDGVDLGPVAAGTVAFFDRSGARAIVTTFANPDARSGPTTRAFDAETGDETAVWIGLDASNIAIGGLGPVVNADGEAAGVFAAEVGCDGGFVLVHPGIDGGDGRCIEGANPVWSPNAQLLVFARGREVIALSPTSDSERVLVRGTPPADANGGPLLRWSPDGSWILIQWPWDPTNELGPAR